MIPVVYKKIIGVNLPAKIDYHELIQADKIFYSSWVFIGHESEVKKRGDYITRDIGRSSVIMVRGKDEAIQVIVNRCQHRGNLLCNESQGNKRNFTCPYHGWVFGLNGDLLDVSYTGGFDKPLNELNLEVLVIDSYRGFVFASFEKPTVSFDDYLGHGKALIDRACNMSPNGKIDLKGGWIRQHFDANWKMLPENDTDGYHVNYVHQSFVRAIDSQYGDFVGAEDSIKGVIKNRGNGHTEIDFAPGYTKTLDWLGSTSEKVKSYVESMTETYGKEKADQMLYDGPPHACIFPNLFLAEMNIVIFQPTGSNTAVQWSTPMFLDGAPELDFKLLRQSEGALGPASFLLADDASIAERAQIALGAGMP